MYLFKVKITYETERIKNIPLNFYVIAEDEIEASDKISNFTQGMPDEIKSFYFITEPEKLAVNYFKENNDIIIT